jgi:hypothetical protein
LSTFAMLTRAGSLAACIAISGTMAVPTVALANATTTAIIVGAIIGTLIYDSNRQQYYYVNNGNRRYVDNTSAQMWYQRQDPQYFRAHQRDFRGNPQQFDRAYRSSHPQHPPHPPHPPHPHQL